MNKNNPTLNQITFFEYELSVCDERARSPVRTCVWFECIFFCVQINDVTLHLF